MGKKFNIGILGTATLPIPPFKGYGGTQRGIYDFLVQMNSKGHRVHLFGPGDSEVSHLENVLLHSFVDQSLWIPENAKSIETKRTLTAKHYEESLKRLKEIAQTERLDIINIRTDNLEVMQEVVNKFGIERIVYSLHNVKDQSRIETIKDSGIQCVAHCRNHKNQHSDLPNIKTIMYGIDVSSYHFSEKTLSESGEAPTLKELVALKKKGQDYLLTLGAIGRHKGQKTCIELAREVDTPLIIAGAPQDRTSNEKQRYFDENIAQHIDGKRIIYFGNANEEQKKELLKFSKAFLFPSGYEDRTWDEPFGRAPVEALSSGTPVVAYRKGSMEEVIYNQFNGYLFDDAEEATEQLRNIKEVNRVDCRRTAEVKFNSPRVADDYEKLFNEIVGRNTSSKTPKHF
ncbi:glycosyltransferase family 4 protein [Candidatus Pacearchaeota archaeon]|nr:glycosyltransferase family 4 protein [Candidatus Pacearchaeota archaeon]